VVGSKSLFGWLVADGWCWLVLREEYCWLVAGGWFVLREKYCWLVADKPSEQGVNGQGKTIAIFIYLKKKAIFIISSTQNYQPIIPKKKNYQPIL
jgi:hypothetical protein